jgi:hypothetical protein
VLFDHVIQAAGDAITPLANRVIQASDGAAFGHHAFS